MRTEIEQALADLITNERGLDFQRIAVPLAQARHPTLVASEPKKDGGKDAFEVGQDGGLSVACSISPTWAKIKKDIERIRERGAALTELWFYTPAVVTTLGAEDWVKDAKADYGIHLVVFSLEEVVTRLLEPRFHYLLKDHLGISAPLDNAVSSLFQQLHDTSSARLNEWRSYHQAGGTRTVERQFQLLEDEPRGDIAFSSDELVARMHNGGFVLIEGEGGLGKTVALGQIAAKMESPTRTNLLLSAPAWGRSGKSLAEYLQTSSGAIAPAAAAWPSLLMSGAVALFVNGLNEVEPASLPRLIDELISLRLTAPGCPVAIASRTATPAESLRCSVRVRLLPLSDSARRELIEAHAPEVAATVVDAVSASDELDQLSRVPLFLAPIVDAIRTGQAPPRSRRQLLALAVVSIESAPDHARFFSQVAERSRARAALSRIGFELSQAGTTEAGYERAAQWISEDPRTADAMLDLLSQHHVLERHSDGHVRFQHQYFQDWFAAEHLTTLLRAGADAPHVSSLLNNRRLESAWMLAAENLAEHSAAPWTIDALVEHATLVDLTLCCQLAHVGRERIGIDILRRLRERVGGWLRRPASQWLALRAICEGELQGFDTEIWPLLESSNDQVRLALYRILEPRPFPVSILDQNWRLRTNTWSSERRTEFALEACPGNSADPLALTKAFAVSDPDRAVRAQCLRHVGFYSPQAARQLVPPLSGENLRQVLEDDLLEIYADETIAPFLDPLTELALQDGAAAARAQRYVDSIDPVRLRDVYRRSLESGQHDFYRAPHAFERLRALDLAWVSAWVLRTICQGRHLPDQYLEVLDDIEAGQLLAAAQDLLQRSERGEQPATSALGDLLATGDQAVCQAIFDAWLGLVAAESLRGDRLIDLGRQLHRAPVAQLTRSVHAARDRCTTALVAGRIADLLASAAKNDPDAALAPSDRQVLVVVMERLGELILAEDDPDGHRKMDLARAIGETRLVESSALLQRVRTAEAARADAEMTLRRPFFNHAQYHVRAARALAGDNAFAAMLEMLQSSYFERAAVSELIDLVGPTPAVRTGVLTVIDWAAATRAQQRGRDGKFTDERALVAAEIRKKCDETDRNPRRTSLEDWLVLGAIFSGAIGDDAPLHQAASQKSRLFSVGQWFDTLIRFGVPIPVALPITALSTFAANDADNWHQPDDHLFIQIARGLLYADDLTAARRHLEDYLGEHAVRMYRRRDLLHPLRSCPMPQRGPLLLALQPRGNEEYWHEWDEVFAALPGPEQSALITTLLDGGDELLLPHVQGAAGHHKTLAQFVAVVRSDPDLRRSVELRARSVDETPARTFARQLALRLGDDAALMLFLEIARQDTSYRRAAEDHAVRFTRWQPRSSSPFPGYGGLPQALPRSRAHLFRAAHFEADVGTWSLDVLFKLDTLLEGNYPADEPRHPDLTLGLDWP